MDFDERRKAYACDVTYGTAKEFGFDFLKDRLIKRQLDEGGGDLGAMLTGGTAAAAAGLTVVEIDVSELHLADGGLTCLSLRRAAPGGWCA